MKQLTFLGQITICLLLLPFVTKSQDFYTPSTIREVRITIPFQDWDVKLDSLKKNNPDARLIGKATVDGVFFDSIGVRYKGNSSYFRSRKEAMKKLPLNVRLNFVKKGQKLASGHTTLRFSNAFLDPSFIRDPLMYEVVRFYMPAPQCNFSKMYINDKYYGIYTNTESVDTVFLKKQFGTTQGHIIKCDPDNWQKVRSQPGCPKGENASLSYLNESVGCYEAFYEVDDVDAWKPLLRLIKTLNKTPDKIETVLNVDQALWMLALNNVMVNLDSYNGSLSHNYYLFADTTGVCHPVMWDFNMAFGGWRRNMSFEELTDEQLIRFEPLADISNAKRPLISQLFKNPYFRKIYIAHYRTIVNEFLKDEQLMKHAQKLSNDVSAWVQMDDVKLYTNQAFADAYDKTFVNGTDKVIGIRQLMSKRGQWLLQHPLLTKMVPPVITENKVAVNGDKTTVSVVMKAAKTGWLYYRKEKPFVFVRAQMTDDGKNGDITAGDGLFTATVETAKIKEYYFAADNDEAAVTLPARASFEYFKVDK